VVSSNINVVEPNLDALSRKMMFVLNIYPTANLLTTQHFDNRVRNSGSVWKSARLN